MTVQNNLGALYNRLGDHARAAEILEVTLAARRQVLGEHHLEVAVTGFHLANALRRLQRAPEAESHYLQALETMRQAAGARDRRVGLMLNAFAKFRLEQGDLAAAHTAISEALDINLETWPEGHRTTAQSRLIAARIELARGLPETAASLAEAALEVFDQTPGQKLTAAVAAATLALALHELEQPERIETLRNRALATLQDQPRHQQLAQRLAAIEHNR